MSKLKNILAFVAGATIGSVVTCKLIKKKYELIAQEEINSVVEEFTKRHNKSVKIAEKALDFVEEVKEETKVDKKDHENIVKELGYVSSSEDVKKQHDKHPNKYVIAPEIVGDCDYEVVSITYYKDGVLAYDDGEVISNADEIVGADFPTHFGEYEDDSVFVRNITLETDYEILADYRNYSDVFPNKTAPANRD